MKIRFQSSVFLLIGLVIISGCISSHQAVSPSPVFHSNTTITPVTSTTQVSTATTQIPSLVPTSGNPDFRTKGSVDKTYYYIVDGNAGYIPLKVYTGVNEYIESFGDIYTHDDYNQIIDNEAQREYTRPLVKNIQSAAKNPDDDARIAISLVQHIKYDANSINEIQVNQSEPGKYIGRYPYTILYQNWGGICGEKSFLLALILKDLGYEVALLQFDDIHHMAVGVKVPSEYAYGNTGYALIESTAPEIPACYEYSVDGYKTRMSTLSPSKIIKISDGKAFNSISREFADARVQSTIDLAWMEVITANNNVTADIKKLNELKSVAEYWHGQLHYDGRGNLIYDDNYQKFVLASGEYNAYYEDHYLPDYKRLETLYEKFQDIYLPKQKLLNEKYGLTAGYNVGL
nr:hypothetical protein [uncultured Methanoregula sp.]